MGRFVDANEGKSEYQLCVGGATSFFFLSHGRKHVVLCFLQCENLCFSA